VGISETNYVFVRQFPLSFLIFPELHLGVSYVTRNSFQNLRNSLQKSMISIKNNKINEFP